MSTLGGAADSLSGRTRDDEQARRRVNVRHAVDSCIGLPAADGRVGRAQCCLAGRRAQVGRRGRVDDLAVPADFPQDPSLVCQLAADLVDLLMRSNAGSPDELGVREAIRVLDRVKDDVSVRHGPTKV
jgi:hypothetical protein